MSTALTILRALEALPTVIDTVTGAITVTREAVDSVRNEVEGVEDAVTALAKPATPPELPTKPEPVSEPLPTEDVPYLTVEVVAKRELCNSMVGQNVQYVADGVTNIGSVELALPTHVTIGGNNVFYSSLSAIKVV